MRLAPAFVLFSFLVFGLPARSLGKIATYGTITIESDSEDVLWGKEAKIPEGLLVVLKGIDPLLAGAPLKIAMREAGKNRSAEGVRSFLDVTISNQGDSFTYPGYALREPPPSRGTAQILWAHHCFGPIAMLVGTFLDRDNLLKQGQLAGPLKSLLDQIAAGNLGKILPPAEQYFLKKLKGVAGQKTCPTVLDATALTSFIQLAHYVLSLREP